MSHGRVGVHRVDDGGRGTTIRLVLVVVVVVVADESVRGVQAGLMQDHRDVKCVVVCRLLEVDRFRK